jgi:hypothetical protein
MPHATAGLKRIRLGRAAPRRPLAGSREDRRTVVPGIPGNPLGYARDIAEGSAPFSVLQFKKMTPDELRKMFSNINIVLREVRTTAVAEHDIDGMRRRAHKLQRLSNALLLLETHAKKLRLTL